MGTFKFLLIFQVTNSTSFRKRESASWNLVTHSGLRAEWAIFSFHSVSFCQNIDEEMQLIQIHTQSMLLITVSHHFYENSLCSHTPKKSRRLALAFFLEVSAKSGVAWSALDCSKLASPLSAHLLNRLE